MAGEVKLAEYFLSILNLGEEYKKWAKLSISETGSALPGDGISILGKKKRQYPTDHTQVHTNVITNILPLNLVLNSNLTVMIFNAGFHCQ